MKVSDCSYRIFWGGVWKSSHAKIKFWKSCSKSQFCEDFPVMFDQDLSARKYERACLPHKETPICGGISQLQNVTRWDLTWWCHTSRSNQVDLTQLFWVLNARNIWKYQEDPQTSTKLFKPVQSLWISPKCTANTWDSLGNTLWTDIIYSWKRSLDLLHLQSSLTYCTDALTYTCCCVVCWIDLQRGSQAAVINSDRNVKKKCLLS